MSASVEVISSYVPMPVRDWLEGGDRFGGAFGRAQRHFDHLIERIAEHGGDVVKMAGDALIAVWSAVGSTSLAQATLRAATCGLVVGSPLQDYEVASGIRLTS
jgi:class 3 adenylate cyclase